jgi:hypothetical protein
MYPLTVLCAPLSDALPVAVLRRHSRGISTRTKDTVKFAKHIHNDGRQQSLGLGEIKHDCIVYQCHEEHSRSTESRRAKPKRIA